MLSDSRSPLHLAAEVVRTIREAIFLSIENKDTETFEQLDDFITARLISSFISENVKSFEQLSYLFVSYYDYALRKRNSSITHQPIYEICAKRSAQSLRMKLSFLSPFQEKEPTSFDEIRKINLFSGILMTRYAELIQICLRKNDISHISFLLTELAQSSDGFSHELAQLKWQILANKRNLTTSGSLSSISSLEERYRLESFRGVMIRLLLKATLFWCLYLFQNNCLSGDELNRVLDIFTRYRVYIHGDFLEDLINMRSRKSEHDDPWGSWDYMERPSGVVYSLPSPSYWITFGALLFSLRNKLPITIDSEGANPAQISETETLLDALIGIANSVQTNGFLKWGTVIGVSSEEEFKQLFEHEKERLTSLKNTAIAAKEIIISDQPLSQDKVRELKLQLIKGWESSNDIHTLFDHFDAIETSVAEIPDESILTIGIKNDVWIGYKVNLIDDPSLYIPLYGIEKRGQWLADDEENLFLSLFSAEGRPNHGQLVDEIRLAIKDLTSRHFNASIIMCGFDVWDQHFNHDKPSDFIFDWNDNRQHPFANYGGKYNDIPIIYLRSVPFYNKVIIADFKAAFSLHQVVDPQAHKNVLRVNITAISSEVEETLITQNPNYWRKYISQGDAVTKLRNSVLVDFFLVENFLVKDILSFITVQTKS